MTLCPKFGKAACVIDTIPTRASLLEGIDTLGTCVASCQDLLESQS